MAPAPDDAAARGAPTHARARHAHRGRLLGLLRLLQRPLGAAALGTAQFVKLLGWDPRFMNLVRMGGSPSQYNNKRWLGLETVL